MKAQGVILALFLFAVAFLKLLSCHRVLTCTQHNSFTIETGRSVNETIYFPH